MCLHIFIQANKPKTAPYFFAFFFAALICSQTLFASAHESLLSCDVAFRFDAIASAAASSFLYFAISLIVVVIFCVPLFVLLSDSLTIIDTPPDCRYKKCPIGQLFWK